MNAVSGYRHTWRAWTIDVRFPGRRWLMFGVWYTKAPGKRSRPFVRYHREPAP